MSIYASLVGSDVLNKMDLDYLNTLKGDLAMHVHNPSSWAECARQDESMLLKPLTGNFAMPIQLQLWIII